MGKVTGFLEFDREETQNRPVEQRLRDWSQVQSDPKVGSVQRQAARCMDCGVPFCHQGCPLGNIIPDWNDLAYRDQWRAALDRLHATNNFPEFTGLVCPAPCEAACVLGINQPPVTIKQIEWEIIRRGWEEGWIQPIPPARRTGRSVAIVGSGPSGLTAAQQLNRVGHTVTVFEKQDRIGGLLRYGIPDFKLEKGILDRRLEQLFKEGVRFETGVEVGGDLTAEELRERFDAVLLCLGAEQPRDIEVPGRELDGVHFAMDFLRQSNRRIAGDTIASEEEILATGKDVIVIGGGDTGSDCVGTSHRQGAKSVTSIELLERPPNQRDASTPWPMWPLVYRTSSSHDEGGERKFAVTTKALLGEGGRVSRLRAARLEFGAGDRKGGRRSTGEVEGSEFDLDADLVLLAIGFSHPRHEGAIASLGLRLDARGNVAAGLGDYATSQPGVFAAGDCRRGQSLVVWAQWEGREAARAVDRYLNVDSSSMPRSDRPA